MTRSSLAPCPGCERHVRTGESRCPFCGADTAALVPPPLRPSRRAGRLAMVAGAVLLGTACGSTTSPEPEPVSEEPAAASGEDPAPLPPEEPAAEEEPVDDPGSQVEMYGGPPLDELV